MLVLKCLTAKLLKQSYRGINSPDRSVRGPMIQSANLVNQVYLIVFVFSSRVSIQIGSPAKSHMTIFLSYARYVSDFHYLMSSKNF